jgi:hypothetical protein
MIIFILMIITIFMITTQRMILSIHMIMRHTVRTLRSWPARDARHHSLLVFPELVEGTYELYVDRLGRSS